ncbi:hypothetical protein [Deinococcus peraridilitoris]|uniref:Uncharacterized protein n=1 Tax=Deinococcus peraridilitoris (strain DSM 19664 / LMG 22246 / CIP 109416 / KR-200) TaxID=937777 RepID=L0A1K8_DEIPD|nr:hypothetical protein [Deinococcus peraridilitoris]AFZ67711.1 hypothetical protein Deipe_2226 [Deinococcus peraridilitoris DSM 19664]
MHTLTKRWLELLSIVLIGDGVVSVVRPVGHSLTWWAPLPGVQPLMEWCAERPLATRLIGASQVAVGLAINAALSRDERRTLPEN